MGKLLYEFVHATREPRCELVDHRWYGIEARIFHNEDVSAGGSASKRGR